MFTRHSMYARKGSKNKWLYYGKLHLEEEGRKEGRKKERKKERNIQKKKN